MINEEEVELLQAFHMELGDFAVFPDRSGIFHWSGVRFMSEDRREATAEIWQDRIRATVERMPFAVQGRQKKIFQNFKEAEIVLDQFEQWIIEKIDMMHYPWGLSTQKDQCWKSLASIEYHRRVALFIAGDALFYSAREFTDMVPKALRERVAEAFIYRQQFRTEFLWSGL